MTSNTILHIMFRSSERINIVHNQLQRHLHQIADTTVRVIWFRNATISYHITLISCTVCVMTKTRTAACAICHQLNHKEILLSAKNVRCNQMMQVSIVIRSLCSTTWITSIMIYREDSSWRRTYQIVLYIFRVMIYNLSPTRVKLYDAIRHRLNIVM